MIKRWLDSRSFRKFTRNRMAIAALLVIGLFLLTSFMTSKYGLGLISEQDTQMYVGPANVPGFGYQAQPDQRTRDAGQILENIERALKDELDQIEGINRSVTRLLEQNGIFTFSDLADRDVDSLKQILRRGGGSVSDRDPSAWPAEAERMLGEKLADGEYRRRLDSIEFGQLVVVDLPPDQIRRRVDRAWEVYDELSETENIDQAPELWEKVDQMDTIIYTELFELKDPNASWKRELEMLWGTDRQGRSIFLRAIYSIEIAMLIGVVVGLIAVAIGTILGLAAGFYGGWVDHLVSWLFTVFSSIPSLVLLVLLAAMFRGSAWEGTLIPMYIAFSMTYWVGPCRVVRGEVMKLKEQEYVHAATVAGFSKPYIMLRHIMPNTAHLMLIYFSLLFIAAVKGEVILTYLGLGIKNGTSWGIMIQQSAAEVINGFFWQIGAATILMFFLVLAFNILSDALQDVFDPKHV